MITMKKRLLALGVAAGLLMGCLPGALGAEENETQKLENTYRRGYGGDSRWSRKHIYKCRSGNFDPGGGQGYSALRRR